MRWCILPAHTHSQIRLDLHESNAKSAVTGKPRAHVCARARSSAVKLVFSPRNKHKCTTATETNANRTPSPLHRKGGGASPPLSGHASPLNDTHRSKRSCPGSRACNPARSNTSQYTSTRAHTLTYTIHGATEIQLYTILHT